MYKINIYGFTYNRNFTNTNNIKPIQVHSKNHIHYDKIQENIQIALEDLKKDRGISNITINVEKYNNCIDFNKFGRIFDLLKQEKIRGWYAQCRMKKELAKRGLDRYLIDKIVNDINFNTCLFKYNEYDHDIRKDILKINIIQAKQIIINILMNEGYHVTNLFNDEKS